MGGRVGIGIFREQDQALVREICTSWNGRRRITRNGTISVAQAIVLAQGVKALQGDKSAAEFLQKLSESREESTEKPSESENVTVRVRLIE